MLVLYISIYGRVSSVLVMKIRCFYLCKTYISFIILVIYAQVVFSRVINSSL